MVSASSPNNNLSVTELLERFTSGSPRQRRGLLQTIEERASDLVSLGPAVMASFDPESDNWSAGWILQVLQKHEPSAVKVVLSQKTAGWFNSPSSVGIDYSVLQAELLNQNFEEADRFTSKSLRELAGTEAVRRGYVYFSEIDRIPGIDLVTIDRLWIAYSQGRFGFSVQASLLKALGGRYDKLWPRIGWKKEGVWTRYPSAFTWSIDAPEGHMPLVNQLRGVRLMDAILRHPSLVDRS